MYPARLFSQLLVLSKRTADIHNAITKIFIRIMIFSLGKSCCVNIWSAAIIAQEYEKNTKINKILDATRKFSTIGILNNSFDKNGI